MKILVTGGTGVIGAGLVPELLKRGHGVVLLSRHAEGAAENYPDQVSAFRADVTDPERMQGATVGCEAVVHIAGIAEESPPEVTFEKVNIAGTRHLLREAERTGTRRFLFISSLGADRGQSGYHRSKLQAEQLVQESSLDWTILRPGNVYGPGDEVISMLLKLVRSMPAVPVVGSGEQRFQPIWFEDLGKAIVEVVESPAYHRQILELAGDEITTTREIISKLGEVTDRSATPLSIPTAVVSAATRAAETIEPLERWLENSGLTMPITRTKLQMLLEENFIRAGSENALSNRLGITPTPLKEGLRRLAEELPELLPEEGFGALERKRYAIEIMGSQFNAAELLKQICEKINVVMPIEFKAEPGGSNHVEENTTLTGAIPGRGHVQVRTLKVTEHEVILVTIQGHPMAGSVVFKAKDLGMGSIQFVIEITARAANVLDWIAMRLVGKPMQNANWRGVLSRVVELSGGQMGGPPVQTSESLSEPEAAEFNDRLKEMITEQSRREHSAR